MTARPISLPFRIGYFLETVDATIARRPDRPYRGIERMYFVQWPDFPPVPVDASRERLWDRYFEARESGELHYDLALARELRAEFSQVVGLDLEIIYAEIVELGASADMQAVSASLSFPLPNRGEINNRLADVGPIGDLLGFDLSTPVPSFHSLICNPWNDQRDQDRMLNLLNDNGLFYTRSAASEFLRVSRARQHAGLPFVVLAVYAVTG